MLLAVCLAAFAAGCGGGGGSTSDSEKAADNETLNDLLARELTVVQAYGASLALARGQTRALALQLRGQDQAHVDALTKAIRGVGGEIEAEPLPLEEERPANEAEALTLAYEEEDDALAQVLGEAPRLQTYGPRELAAALAASHAQHLVVLRQALGAGPLAAVPGAFEPGDEPPPEGR